MPKLSELLSANSNSVNVTSYSIAPGDVFKVFDNRTTPPKIKYHIVVGISEERILLGTVRINSNLISATLLSSHDTTVFLRFS